MNIERFEIDGKRIHTTEDGLYSLNDVYALAQAKGEGSGKFDPRMWSRRPFARKSGTSGNVSTSGGPGWDFIAAVAEKLNVSSEHILKTKRGKGGGTYAHKQIVLAYAEYLSPALHMLVNETFMRVMAGDVTIAEEVADRATVQDQERLAVRLMAKTARNSLTQTLSQHGVTGRGFADCTNAIYRPILGGTKSQVCEKRGLPMKTNLRDAMDLEELARTQLAEILARKRINVLNVQGNERCAAECGTAASAVAAIN